MAKKNKKGSEIGVPPEAVAWVRRVFAGANKAVSGLLSMNPTQHEPELDMALISALNHAPPVSDAAGWTVYIQTHFLGGRRHFYHWEVADIGLLVVFKDRGKVLRVKTALLQSKRLYPKEQKLLPPLKEKFQLGFGSLLHVPEAFQILAAGRTFSFDAASKYAALEVGSEQERVLHQYSKTSGIPVYYLLYNPAEVPRTATVPATKLVAYRTPTLGCRVLDAERVRQHLAAKHAGYHPTLADVSSLGEPYVKRHESGWRLEHFVADLVLRCKQGHVTDDKTDHVLENLFYRREGPIAAAIAVTIEAPDGVDFTLPDVLPPHEGTAGDDASRPNRGES